MDKKTFEHEMIKTEAFRTLEKDHVKVQYWYGYQRGLRRTFHGEKFGTEAEHNQYMNLINDLDEGRQELGRGYRAGLKME